jgi:hypothetical protein
VQYNPYAPPQAPPYPQHPQQHYYQQAPADVRLEGDVLVAANGTVLPDVCVKCGVRHGLDRRHQKFQFVPYWARFFGPLIQLIVMKRSEFSLPICQTCHGQWKKWNLIAGLTWVPFLLIMFAGFGLEDVGPVLALVGFVGMLVALITTLIIRMKYIVVAKKIDKTHSWLGKIHPQALEVIVTPHAPPTQPAPYAYAPAQ